MKQKRNCKGRVSLPRRPLVPQRPPAMVFFFNLSKSTASSGSTQLRELVIQGPSDHSNVLQHSSIHWFTAWTTDTAALQTRIHCILHGRCLTRSNSLLLLHAAKCLARRAMLQVQTTCVLLACDMPQNTAILAANTAADVVPTELCPISFSATRAQVALMQLAVITSNCLGRTIHPGTLGLRDVSMLLAHCAACFTTLWTSGD